MSLADEVEDGPVAVDAIYHALLAAAAHGDLQVEGRLIHRLAQLAESTRLFTARRRLHEQRAGLFLLRGDWKRMEAELVVVDQLFRDTDCYRSLPVVASTGSLFMRHRVAYLTGDRIAAARALQVLVRRRPSHNVLSRIAYAATVFEAWMEDDRDRIERVEPEATSRASMFLGVDVLISALRRDQERARFLIGRLTPWSGGFVTGRARFGPADRCLGILAAVCGDVDDSVAHFDRALEFLIAREFAAEEALCRLDLASVLVEHQRDLDRARTELLRVQEIAGRLNMITIRDWARRMLRALPSVAFSILLSPREHEVLALIIEGLTNKEIGARLSIAPRTVAVHVGNILRKTGSASRTDAATWALRNGFDSGVS